MPPQRHLRRDLFLGNTQQPGEFALEMPHRPQARAHRGQVVEGAAQQIVKRRVGMLGFDSGLKQPAAVARQQQTGITRPQPIAAVDHRNLAQRVQITPARALKFDFRRMKQIESARKGTRRTPRPLGRRAHQPMGVGGPMNNPTRVAKPDQADQRGLRGMHDFILAMADRFGDGEFPPTRVGNIPDQAPAPPACPYCSR